MTPSEPPPLIVEAYGTVTPPPDPPTADEPEEKDCT